MNTFFSRAHRLFVTYLVFGMLVASAGFAAPRPDRATPVAGRERAAVHVKASAVIVPRDPQTGLPSGLVGVAIRIYQHLTGNDVSTFFARKSR